MAAAGRRRGRMSRRHRRAPAPMQPATRAPELSLLAGHYIYFA
jgi:hypothetical protein